MTLYHVTTPKKARLYGESKRIIAPVRGFDSLQGAMAWAIKVGRPVILEIECEVAWPLPDHSNRWGAAYWTPSDVTTWRGVYHAEQDA